jgi:hypothetical protein
MFSVIFCLLQKMVSILECQFFQVCIFYLFPLEYMQKQPQKIILSLGAFLKTTELLSNLIPPILYYLTNLVSGAYAPVVLMPRGLQ